LPTFMKFDTGYSISGVQPRWYSFEDPSMFKFRGFGGLLPNAIVLCSIFLYASQEFEKVGKMKIETDTFEDRTLVSEPEQDLRDIQVGISVPYFQYDKIKNQLINDGVKEDEISPKTIGETILSKYIIVYLEEFQRLTEE